MSTRSNIIVRDKFDCICIYRHSDGYPDGEHGVIATLNKALDYAWDLPRFEASDFSAAIVAAWKQPSKSFDGKNIYRGGNIYIDGNCPKSNPFKKVHPDCEFVYIIDPPLKDGKMPQITCYSVEWRGSSLGEIGFREFAKLQLGDSFEFPKDSEDMDDE